MSEVHARWDIRQASRELLVGFFGLLLVNLAFYGIFVRPRVNEYSALTTKNAPRIAELERREAGVKVREAYLQGLEQAEDDLERLRRDVLQTRDRRIVIVQQEVEELAQQFSLQSTQITYQNEILKNEGIERYGTTLPLEGGYANLRKFIQALEKSEKFLVIERVALGEGQEGGVMIQLNITLATYFDLPELNRETRPGARAARRA